MTIGSDASQRPDSQGRRRKLRYSVAALAAAVVLAIAAGAAAMAVNWDATVTGAAFSLARHNPTRLRNFLYRMPKGADLHTHLSGAVYAERYIDWAAADGLSLLVCNMTIVKLPLDKPPKPPCDKANDFLPMKDVAQDQALRDRVINALSMRNFVPTAAEPSGHDHFFATFGKFSAVTKTHFIDMVVDQLAHYGSESVQYVELMKSFSDSDEREPFVAAIGNMSDDYPAMLAAIRKAGLDAFIAKRKKKIDGEIEAIENQLNCDPPRTRPGCDVTYRFIAQVSRNKPLADVFVQTAIAAALARADSHVVGFNFVQPEDYAIARRDYTAQMKLIGFLATHPPDEKSVNVALHAGELWLGLVPLRDLTFHIEEAVEIAGAKRIGHGVSLAFERHLGRLLKEMRARPAAVEINLTSNAMILGVKDAEHPFPAYRAAGVPVVLSTDDAGVERVDLTNEYFRAARDYQLDYSALKGLAHASLVYSFLDGAEKKAELDRFDKASAAFERSVASRRSFLKNLALVVSANAAWW